MSASFGHALYFEVKGEVDARIERRSSVCASEPGAAGGGLPPRQSHRGRDPSSFPTTKGGRNGPRATRGRSVQQPHGGGGGRVPKTFRNPFMPGLFYRTQKHPFVCGRARAHKLYRFCLLVFFRRVICFGGVPISFSWELA